MTYFNQSMFGYSPLQRQLDQYTKEQELRNAMLKSAGTTNAPVWRMGMLNAAMGAGDKLYEGITGKPIGLNAVQGEVDRMQQGYRGAIRGMDFKDSQSMRAAATKLHQTGMTDQALKLLKMADEVDSRGKSATDKYGTTFKGDYDGETVVVTPTNGAPKVFRMNGEEITEQVDPKKLTVHRGTTGETPWGYANIENFMTAYKGGVDKDVAAFKDTAKDLTTRFPEVQSNVGTINTIRSAREQLKNNPDINVGLLGKTKQLAQKTLNALGITATVDPADTEAFQATTKALAGALLASGMFGSGTGISERDLQTAMEMVGAEQSLTPEGILKIFDILEEKAKGNINRWNDDLSTYNPKIWDFTTKSQSGYKIKVPEQVDLRSKYNLGE